MSEQRIESAPISHRVEAISLSQKAGAEIFGRRQTEKPIKARASGSRPDAAGVWTSWLENSDQKISRSMSSYCIGNICVVWTEADLQVNSLYGGLNLEERDG